jgi:hypothetical protein
VNMYNMYNAVDTCFCTVDGVCFEYDNVPLGCIT